MASTKTTYKGAHLTLDEPAHLHLNGVLITVTLAPRWVEWRVGYGKDMARINFPQPGLGYWQLEVNFWSTKVSDTLPASNSLSQARAQLIEALKLAGYRAKARFRASSHSQIDRDFKKLQKKISSWTHLDQWSQP